MQLNQVTKSQASPIKPREETAPKSIRSTDSIFKQQVLEEVMKIIVDDPVSNTIAAKIIKNEKEKEKEKEKK